MLEFLQKLTSETDTFDNIFKIENDFAKYLKVGGWQCFHKHFFPNIFLTMLLSARFHQNCQAGFGRYEHKHCHVGILLPQIGKFEYCFNMIISDEESDL